jgi:hypothetical protein
MLAVTLAQQMKLTGLASYEWFVRRGHTILTRQPRTSPDVIFM